MMRQTSPVAAHKTAGSSKHWWLLALGGLLGVLAGCGDTTACGPGTIEVGGKCVVVIDAVACGPGTSAVGGLCVADAAQGGADGEGVDTAAGSDTAAGTDATVQTDASTQTDALAETDTNATTDATAETDVASGSDASGETDATDPPDICQANCIGRVCGPDGCGGSCGTCTNAANPVCNDLTGQCQASCVPQCQGKTCGDNGCGGVCGTCGAGSTCEDSICVPDAWTCDASWYAAADACDCDCGAPDPDCGLPFMALAGCDDAEFCNAAGKCESKVPAGWTCEPLAYDGKDYCNCGCGVLDPDCTYGLPVLGCQTQGATCSAQGTCEECTPDCNGKFCGPDGCGGICGTCDDVGKPTCDDSGQCIDPCEGSVKFACLTNSCGDDGCGGSCGSCGADQTCTFGQCKDNPIGGGPNSCLGNCGSKAPSGCSCVAGCEALGTCCSDFAALCTCQPKCDGKTCGPDTCGGECGSCSGATPFCSDAGQCVASCTPKCDGKQCGDDGCGGSCGSCGSGETCGFTSQCVPASWKCDQSYYADGLACDCGCGAADPDCAKQGSSVFGCPAGVACSASGTCSATFCAANSDCGAQWCMGVWAQSKSGYAGICGTPLQSSAAPGAPCSFNEACASNVCLAGFCRSHCGNDADCFASERCLGLPVRDEVTGGVVGHSAACDGVVGTAAVCTKQADCTAVNERCIGRVDPTTYGPRYLCELTPSLPAPGASCLIMDCPDWQVCTGDKSGAPVCASHCPGGGADCPAGFACVQRPLHNAGTPDPSDDPQVPVCIPN